MVPTKPNFKLTIFDGDGEYVICRRFFGIWFPIVAKRLVSHPFDIYFLWDCGEHFHVHVERITQALRKNKSCIALKRVIYA